MNLKNFVIASLLLHFVFLLVVWFVNVKTSADTPEEPMIAKIIPFEDIIRPPIKDVPKREERQIIKKKNAVTPPPPVKRVPPIEDSEPPKTMEGEGMRTKKSAEESLERKKGKHSLDSEDLKLAEKRAVEELLREERKGDVGEEGEGEITFSTKEFKYYGYKIRLKEKIESIWTYPPEAAAKGIYADLYIRFTILRDGKLGTVDLMRTSGYKMLDDAALKALKDAAPFWPLPVEWDEDSFTITGHFIYSLYGYYLR